MAEGFPLGRTEVIAGIDEIVIHIIQDIEDRQNHKGKLDVACDKDKGEICKKQLLRTDSDEFQELVNGAILTKNPNKGISLEEEIDPSRQDDQHKPELTVLETSQKEGCRIADEKRHHSHNPCIEHRIEAHFKVGQVLGRKVRFIVF